MKTPETKQTEAQARQQAARSPEEQLKYLDSKGFVATKERKKLQARIKAARKAAETK
jgi:hypothetical protein